jgi:hypothetical protein
LIREFCLAHHLGLGCETQYEEMKVVHCFVERVVSTAFRSNNHLPVLQSIDRASFELNSYLILNSSGSAEQ